MLVPTSSVAIVMLYAGLNALIAFVLALQVVRQRGRAKVSLGTGGDAVLERVVRAHGNFIEYVPLILVLMLLLELSGLGAIWIHAMGIALTMGRILHGWGLSATPNESFGRFAGTALTWLTLLAALILCIARGSAALMGGAIPGGSIG
jgi:uncharacterized protein